MPRTIPVVSCWPPWRCCWPAARTAPSSLWAARSRRIRDDALLGSWKPTAESEEDFLLTFRSEGGATLSVLAESPGEEPARYPAFVSELGGRRFLNLQDTEDSGRWYFANYLFHEGRLRLRLVDDELIGSQTFASAEELAAFLQGNLDDPRLYGGQEAEEWDWELERVAPKRTRPRLRLSRVAAGQRRAVDPLLDPQQVHQVEGAGAVAQQAHLAEGQQDFRAGEAVPGQVEGIAALAPAGAGPPPARPAAPRPVPAGSGGSSAKRVRLARQVCATGGLPTVCASRTAR